MPMPSEDSIIGKDAVMPDKFIAAMAMEGGFQGGDAVTAVAVALAESGGRPGAVNHNANGTKDFGLWQINSVHSELFAFSTGNYWDQPQTNAKMARVIWQQAGGSWRPWSAYTNGRYLMYMGRAQVAVANADLEGAKQWVRDAFQKAVDEGRLPSIGAGIPDAVEGIANPLVDILKIIGKIFDPKTWASIGIVLAGAVMLLLVGWQLLKSSPVPKSIKGVVS